MGKWYQLVLLTLTILVTRWNVLQSSEIDDDLDKQCGLHTLPPHVKCVYQDVDCDLFTSDPSHQSKDWPGPPSEFYVDTFVGESSPGLNFTWKPPANVGLRFVKGFFLKLLNMKGGSDCIFLNLTGTEWGNIVTDSQILFQYSCFENIAYGDSYYALIQSMPIPEPGVLEKNMKYMFFDVLPKSGDKSDPANWTPAIIHFNITNDTTGAKAEIYFDRAPEHFNFDEYQITLNMNSSSRNDQTKETKFSIDGRIKVEFGDICSGAYRIQILPKRRNGQGDCVCGKADFLGMTCKECLMSQTKLINIQPENPCSSEALHISTNTDAPSTRNIQNSTSNPGPKIEAITGDENNDLIKILVPALIAAIVVFALIAVVAIVVSIRRRHQTDENNNHQDYCQSNIDGFSGNGGPIDSVSQYSPFTYDNSAFGMFSPPESSENYPDGSISPADNQTVYLEEMQHALGETPKISNLPYVFQSESVNDTDVKNKDESYTENKNSVHV